MNLHLLRPAALCLLLVAAISSHAADITATWNFQTLAAGAVAIEGSTGTVTSDIEGIELYVDATKGKLKSRGSDAQFNAGTTVRIPVKSTRDYVSVVSYPGYHNYTLSGAEADADSIAHRATAAEAAAGYVELVGVKTSYLYRIHTTIVSPIQEKNIYDTDFTSWPLIERKDNNAEPTTQTFATKYSHEQLTFTLCGVGVYPEGTNAKFADVKGFMQSAKYKNEVSDQEPYVVTSPLRSVTKVVFHQAATGSNRGWAMAVRTAGSTEWEVVYNQSIGTANGEDVTVEVNRENVELKFYNFNLSQNAYMSELHIYGNVDMSTAPMLSSLSANGSSYEAADLFDQDAEGNYTATIEVSKSTDMIDASNPITATASNGTIEAIDYTSVASTMNGDKPQTDATITVKLGEDEARYVIHFVWKPDYTVRYYDTDGTKLVATRAVEKGSTIGKLRDGSKVSVPEGSKFRGWLFKLGGDEKASESTIVSTETLNLYALVTDIEGDDPTERNVYDLTNPYFYVADHEAFVPTAAYSYNSAQHGYYFKPGSVKLFVSGNATIIVEGCKYSKGAITLSSPAGQTIGTAEVAATDGEKTTFGYEGAAGELTLSFDTEVYIHRLTIINTGEGHIAPSAEGYYVATPGNGASLLNILDIIEAKGQSDSRTKIFLPDGTYDLGQMVGLKLPADNISIVGQSMDNTIIVTTPDVAKEGLGSADMLFNTRENLYLQDLTLRNALDYYGAGAAGRAAVMQDRGNRTIYKNVRMLSYQDTYYSQNASMQSYFEGCDIHGTVDFICGGGDVRFQNTTISLEPRSIDGTGGRTITAPTTTTGFGYVFDGCKVIDLAEGKGNWNYGRTWQSQPICVWLGTTLDDAAAATIVEKRWIEKGMNNTDPRLFGEFATTDEAGNDITPASNVIASYTTNLETILTADQAAAYSYDKMFTNWDPRSLAADVAVEGLTMNDGTLQWSASDGAEAYAVFKDGALQGIVNTTSFAADKSEATWTVRAANAMGGFGQPATIKVTTAIAPVTTAEPVNIVYYSVDGMRLSRPQQGVNLCVKQWPDGSKTTLKVVVK